jgi:formylglycine-generating enzyme required for sulfatase activity
MFGSGLNTFDIEFVDIDNAGNAPDVTGNPNPAGSVAKAFRMGKYEISEDMINKANAEGGLLLTKDARGADKPATSVTWNEAARFVNWLNTSTGSPPAYKFAVNPGDAGYTTNAIANTNIQMWAVIDGPAFNPANPYRNSLAAYWLPSVDEWYKAAYYDPNGGAYYDYATGSNVAPVGVGSGTAAGTAVYTQPFGNGPADIMLAGGLSPYGTMGQGGNVFEWEETDFNLVNGPTTDARGLRGGYWSAGPLNLLSTNRLSGLPTGGNNVTGFRVATVPEPSTAMLIAMASLGLLWRKTAS